MHFGLSETQKLLQETTLRFGEKQIPPSILRDQKTFASVQKEFNTLGLGGLLAPETFGGAEGSLLDGVLVQMALGQSAAPIRFLAPNLLTLALKEGGTAEQQKKYFPLLVEGNLKVALALETDTSESDNVRETGGTLSGKKHLAIDVAGATLALLTCDDGVYLAPLTSAQITPSTTIDTTRTFGTLSFDGSTRGEKLNVTPARLLAVAQIGLAADSIGAADFMLAQALNYAKTREQFNRVIASFQAVKHECAEMAAALEPCRAQLWFAAHSFDDEPKEAALNAMLTKIHCSEVSRTVARRAIEVFGGFGFTDEANFHFWFKRIGVNYQLLGAPDVLCEQAARLQFDASK